MWTQHTKFAAPAKAEMQKHPECKDACQQSVAYGTWPEHSCNPKCVWLTKPPPDPLEGMRGMTADDAEALIKECCAQAGRSDTSVFTPVAWNILHRVVQAAHKAGAQARDAALKQTPMTPDQVALNAMVIFQSDFNSLPDYDLAIVRMCERFHKIG